MPAHIHNIHTHVHVAQSYVTACYNLNVCAFLRNPVSKKGYLDLYGEQDAQWHRKYVVGEELTYTLLAWVIRRSSLVIPQVVRRPYVLLYNSDKEPVGQGRVQ